MSLLKNTQIHSGHLQEYPQKAGCCTPPQKKKLEDAAPHPAPTRSLGNGVDAPLSSKRHRAEKGMQALVVGRGCGRRQPAPFGPLFPIE